MSILKNQWFTFGGVDDGSGIVTGTHSIPAGAKAVITSVKYCVTAGAAAVVSIVISDEAEDVAFFTAVDGAVVADTILEANGEPISRVIEGGVDGNTITFITAAFLGRMTCWVTGKYIS